MRIPAKPVLISLTAAAVIAALVACSSKTPSSQVETIGDESTFDIQLDYNAGTGFEWVLKAEPEGVLMLVDQYTEGLSKGPVSGGPLREHFVFRAQSAGEVVLTFTLVRPWESDLPSADTQVYAFTVDKELHAVLNPQKSRYLNEPVYGSNS